MQRPRTLRLRKVLWLRRLQILYERDLAQLPALWGNAETTDQRGYRVLSVVNVGNTQHPWCAVVGFVVIMLGWSSVGGPLQQSTAAPLAADRHTLVVARDVSDAKTLDPDRLFEPTAAVVAGTVYEPLVTFSGADVTHVRPDLATRWTVSSNHRVYTFFLRRGVRFSNGDHLTSADVVFSYRRLGFLNDSPSFLMGAHTVEHAVVIDQVRALNAYTVQFSLPAPDVSFLAALTTPVFGVLDARVVRAHGGDDSPQAAVRDRATPWLNDHSIGTAAFLLTSWTRGSTGQITLTRNPLYWGKRAPLRTIVLRGVPSAVNQRLQVDRGTVDIAFNVDIDGARALRKDANVKVVKGNTLDLVYLAMNTNPAISAPLSKIKVRQAIRAAMDYRGIIQGLLSGIGTRANSMIPVGLIGNDRTSNDRLNPHTNVVLARALLKQAGYPHGFSIAMDYPAGLTFDGISFDLLAPKVAHDLATVGIKVKLTPMPLSVLFPAWRAGRESLILWIWAPDFPETNDNVGAFASGGYNAGHVGYTWDIRSMRLVMQADSTSDVRQRATMYRQVEQTWLHEGPWATIVQPTSIVVLHRGVTNYQFSPVYPSNLAAVRKR